MLAKIWLGLKMFVCYMMPFLPCCPKIGELENGDCIWVQAFGRNTWSDEELGKVLWEIRKKAESLAEALTLLMYAGFNPGEANRALGRKTIRLAKKYGLEISSQWEVVYCLWKIDRVWFADHLAEIHCEWPPELGYYATRDVKLDSRQWMKSRGKSRPIEVCHPAMVARAVSIIWKLGVNVIVERVSFWKFWKNELWVWDKNSVQPWTCVFIQLGDPRKWWLPRESIGRYVHHPLKRWVSFVPPVPS